MSSSSSSSSLTRQHQRGKRTDDVQKKKKVTRLSFFEKKEKSDRFRVLSQKGLLERILHKKSSHKSTHTHRERESCCRYCFCVLFSRAERRTQRWCSQYGPSSQRCTTSFIQEQNNGGYDEWEKIDRRKKEFRNLPKSKTKKQKRYGPPSHILKATIAPKFKEMREQHQSYNNTTTNNSSRGVMFNNGGGGGGGGGGKEEEEFNNNNAKKFNEEENEDGEEEAWRECDVVGKKENTSNEGERAGTPTPTPTTLTTTNNTHATGGGGGERQQQQRRRRARTRTKKTR